MIVEGDFNARTGELRRRGRWGERMGKRRRTKRRRWGRRSKDKEGINREGKRLEENLEELGLTIFNRGIVGDENGEFTYTGGRRYTVIDYMVGARR